MSLIAVLASVPKSLRTIGGTSRSWRGASTFSNGDVLAAVTGDDLYIRYAGSGAFVKLTTNLAGKSMRQVFIDSNDNVFVACLNDHVYMQTNRTGNFVAITTTQGLPYYGIWVSANGDRYTTTNGTGGILKQTGGQGAWSQIDNNNRQWTDICGNPLGEKFSTNGVDVYRAGPGSDTFSPMGMPNLAYRTLCSSPRDNDIYLGIYSASGIVMKRTGGSGGFSQVSSITGNWMASCRDNNGGLYMAILNGAIYYAPRGL